MATTIAALNVKLVASVGGFATGMAGAAKHVGALGSKVASVGAGIGAVFGGLSVAGAVAGVAALTKHSLEAIDTNAKLSDRLGLTTEALVGLQYAGDLAGVSGEQLTGAMEKMLKALGGAADDGELASNAFTKLGLNAAELADLPADEAFARIAQKLSEITNPAERAAAATQIFGRAGQSLLPLLTSGAEGIRAAQEEAAKLGLTYSRMDAAKVEAANDAMTRAGKVVEGVGNQLAIGLAPYIEAAASKLKDFATEGGGIGPKVGGAIEWVANAVAVTADYLNLPVAGFRLLQAGATYAVFGVVKAVDFLGQKFVDLVNLIPGMNVQWTSLTGKLADGLLEEAGKLSGQAGEAFAAFERGDASKAVGRVFAGIREASQASAESVAANAGRMQGAFEGIEDSTKNLQKVAETLAGLRKQVEQFGMTDGQKRVADLKALGASPEQIAEADMLSDRLSAMEAVKKRQDELSQAGRSVAESVMTPMDRFSAREQELSDLLNAGVIDWTVYGRAIASARSELEKATAVPEPKAPDLVRAGSAAAQRFVAEARVTGLQKTSREDYQKQQLAEQKRNTDLLRNIERNTRSTTPEATEVVSIA